MRELSISLPLSEPVELTPGEQYKITIRRSSSVMARISGMLFDTNKTFLLPSTIVGLKRIRKVYEENSPGELLIVGHTDTTGEPSYNNPLSMERAESLKHFLTDNVQEWLNNYKKSVPEKKRWGATEDLMMIETVIGDDTRAYDDNPVRWYQKYHNLKVDENHPDKAGRQKLVEDSDAGEKTRTELIRDYMLLDGTTLDEGSDFDISITTHGCGENFPLDSTGTALDSTPENNKEDQLDRRVELFFFDQETGITPPPGTPEGEEYLQWRDNSDILVDIPVQPVSVELKISEIRGLYTPRFSDPLDIRNGSEKLSGYQIGYKSEDNLGRIFINHNPRIDPAVEWQSVRKKNVQFIELTASLSVTDGIVPPNTFISWEWSDPDDPSNESMNPEASQTVDKNDTSGPSGNDNAGKADFPPGKTSPGARFEQIGPYQLVSESSNSRCTTRVFAGKSRVRLHCTNVGGDSFIVKASLKQHPFIGSATEDETGTMTMWKRIDVEYVRMEGAKELPVDDVPPFFEPCFVQMDFLSEREVHKKEFMSNDDSDFDVNAANYVKAPPVGVFEHELQPGYFFIASAHRATKDVGSAVSAKAYTGPGTVTTITFSDGSKGEAIVIDTSIAEDIEGIELVEGSESLFIPVWAKDDNTPSTGKTTLYLYALDYQSDFEPADGSIDKAYHRTDEYYPCNMFSKPSRVYSSPGLGFSSSVSIIAHTPGSYETGGVSPSAQHLGKDYFAGRTIIFSKHPAYRSDQDLLETIVHEFGHAFGFPHKCGFYSWQNPAKYSCAMNYFNTWLYSPGTRTVQRFTTGDSGQHFCGKHLDGIRKVHLEDNPALWKW